MMRGRKALGDLDRDIRDHLEHQTQEHIARGLSPEAARRAALREFGSTALVKERTRAVWIPFWLEGLWQDVRLGARSLRRSPGLVVVSAASLGLGIGLNALLYMGVNTVYRHQPTMEEPDRVVGVEPGNANQFAYPDYRDLLRSGIFTDALGLRMMSLNMGASDVVFPVGVLAVTANFFDVLGVDAGAGRTFSPADAAPELEPREIVVSHAFWQGQLRAAPDAIGQALVLSGQSFSIIGVLPEQYRAVTGWVEPALYVPISRLVLPTLDERGSPSLSVLARLKPDGSAQQAQAAVTALGASLEQAYPERNEGMSRPASVFPAGEMQFRGTPAAFFLVAGLLWASVALVLIIACVNVTGLLMARAAQRRHEIGIRLAIGAGRGRVVQAMLVESFLLVLGGAAVGLPLAAGFNQVSWRGPVGFLQRITEFDGSLVPYAVAMVAATTLLCGVVPALRATRANIVNEVRQSGGGATPRMWARHALVVGQVAMSVTLIVLAVLCVRSQIEVGTSDLGFDIDHGVVARFSLDATQYPGEERQRFADRAIEQIERIPGVASVGVASLVPLGGDSMARNFHPAGQTDIPGSRPQVHSVGPGYFRTLAIPVLRGRDFTDSDTAGTPVVAVVNETFAATHFSGQNVIGARVQTVDEPEAEVIGVVRDSRIDTIGEAPQSVIYFPFAQRPDRLFVHVRTSLSPDQMVSAVWRATMDLDATVPVSVQTLRSATSTELTMRQAGTYLMGAIGGVGLLLAMVGLYGVMAYLVASRTAELGIRMVLGASSLRIAREVLGQVLSLVASGVAIGAAASMGLTPALRTFLVGVSPYDPVALGAAAVILGVVGLVAGFVPAYRASRVDPMRAVRHM